MTDATVCEELRAQVDALTRERDAWQESARQENCNVQFWRQQSELRETRLQAVERERNGARATVELLRRSVQAASIGRDAWWAILKEHGL